MFTVLAQQGPVQLHLDTSKSARTIRVSSSEPLEALSIMLTAADLPGIALKLLRSVPTTPFDSNLDAAKSWLVQYGIEQEAKQAEAKLQARRDDVAGEWFDLEYEQADSRTQAAVDRIIELEDKLEGQK